MDNEEYKKRHSQGIYLPSLKIWLDPIEILLYLTICILLVGPAIRQAWTDPKFDRGQAFLEIAIAIGTIRIAPTDKIYKELADKNIQ